MKMKRLIVYLIFSLSPLLSYGQIVADHTIVDKYDDIPQYYIDKVKEMWLVYAGESHSAGIRDGLELLEASDPAFAVSITESGTPESYTATHLRASRATWGDLNNSSGWMYSYGEEDWYTSSTAISRTKAGITYCNTHSLDIAVFGFGWCWDPDETDMTDYLSATQEYIDYCTNNDYSTKVIFTTGPVDGVNSYGETGYLKYLAYEDIRNYIENHSSLILFDYADILCYDEGSDTPNTASWDVYSYPIITTTNLGDASDAHIGSAGCLRLAKAMWWMLARIAGWDGVAESIQVESITVTGAGGSSVITTNNGTLQLTATVLPSDATDKSVTWSIINGTGEATISSSGLVTAVSSGTVTARATANDGSGIYGTLVITISNQVILVGSITVTGAGGASVIAKDNGTLQLTATVSPSDATDKSVTWSIINGTGEAAISSSGLITAVSSGTVTARATANDGSGVYGELEININSTVSFTVTWDSYEIRVLVPDEMIGSKACLVSLKGIIMQTKIIDSNECTFSTSGLMPGIYIISVYNSIVLNTAKIVFAY